MTGYFLAFLFFYGVQIPALFSQTVGTEIGNKAPEIRLPSPNGDTVALSSLEGKMVLIDFWASWCAPCVREQPQLAGLYKKYKNATFTEGKGFAISGVSLDSKKTSWENMIRKADISWVQVSDLRFWLSPVAKLYNLQDVPYNLLVNGKGVIIALNLHGEDLEKELAKYLTDR